MLPEISKTMDVATVHAYAVLTDDFNPIHVDPAFAATTPMGRCIAHGMLSLNLIWQWAAPMLCDAARGEAELDVRFTRPVFVGDTVSARGSLAPPSESEPRAIFAVTVENQSGETVISGELRLPVHVLSAYENAALSAAVAREGLQSVTAL